MASGDEPKLTVKFFKTATGTEPVRDWLRGLTKGPRREIGADIKAVQWRWPVSKPLVDGLGRGLYEVRTKFERIQYRVLFYVTAASMVLLHGFIKKTRAAPNEIAIGRERKKEHEKEEQP